MWNDYSATGKIKSSDLASLSASTMAIAGSMIALGFATGGVSIIIPAAIAITATGVQLVAQSKGWEIDVDGIIKEIDNPFSIIEDMIDNNDFKLSDDPSESEGDRELPPETRLPESTVRHAFALYQLPSTEEGFADVEIVPADADWS